ncbi:DNA-binding MarR family transcriptional regulator [Acidovorax sp. 100]|uniref:MarR family winged helix-turn-helix transcriptional regulator n=1 Tax=Acidovorax sp. 100 TaxID=2135635 RepID=UPI000EF98B36|nr:MarR family transcriptional regulator [Acidovorax sp. 100]RMA59941.1 DNA-binding MarR family transcriptional regulator [Acidovorax sp. 100]
MKHSPRSQSKSRLHAATESSEQKPQLPGLGELITLQWQREREDLDLQNFLLAIYFMRLGTLVDRAYDRYCQKHFSINGGDMRLMLALRRSGPPYVKRPTDLFRALLVTSGAITKKVDRLEAAGYVGRSVDPSHSGGFLVHLTKKGLHAVEQAIEHLANHSVLAPAMARLSPEMRKQGSEFTLHMLSALEHAEIDAMDGEKPSPKSSLK